MIEVIEIDWFVQKLKLLINVSFSLTKFHRSCEHHLKTIGLTKKEMRLQRIRKSSKW